MLHAQSARPSPNAQLKIQLGFIETSCAQIDKGDLKEALRIAVSVRIILRSSRTATSLLSQLQVPNVPLLSTCDGPLTNATNDLPAGSMRMLHYDGMGLLSASPGVVTYGPKFGKGSPAVELPADDWWRQLIVAMDPETKFTRRSLVLSVADKDGGAHVDPQIEAAYDRLAYSKEFMGLVAGGQAGSRRLSLFGYHMVALRQIGYELLNSPQLAALAAKA